MYDAISQHGIIHNFLRKKLYKVHSNFYKKPCYNTFLANHFYNNFLQIILQIKGYHYEKEHNT